MLPESEEQASFLKETIVKRERTGDNNIRSEIFRI